MPGDRTGWARGWDLRGATAGLLLVGAAIALLGRDRDVLEALPGLAGVAVVASAALALALAQLDHAVSRTRTRRRVVGRAPSER